MDMDVSDTSVLVTGAGRGIGRTLALGLAAAGARVGVVARRDDAASAVVAEIAESGANRPAHAFVADVTDEEAVTDLARSVESAWGRLDAVINNAGWMPGRHRILDIDVDVLHRVLDANYVSNVLVTKHLAPLMIRSGGGRIVYMSSMAGTQSTAGGAAYGGAKAALNILANVVHQELADDGVRTVAIAPGLTVTPGMEAIITPEHLERTAAQYPGGRVGQPEDLVGLVAFLCSDLSQHLSGTVISVRPPITR